MLKKFLNYWVALLDFFFPCQNSILTSVVRYLQYERGVRMLQRCCVYIVVQTEIQVNDFNGFALSLLWDFLHLPDPNKKNPANNQRLGSAGEINAKALAPTVAVQAYCQIAFYAFAAFLCNSNLDIRIVGFSGCPQYTVTRSIVIIIVYCYEYHDVNNFLCDLLP